jgi:hypothetical protein
MSTQAPNRADPRSAVKGGILARSRLLRLGVLLLLAFYGQGAARSTPRAPRADAILIVKHERKLYLLHDNYPLRSYRIALGLSPTGAKERRWDFRTPEGNYIIDFRPTKPVSYYKTRDWTNGCIALSDEDLQELWDLTAGQTPVEIVP